MSDWLRRIEYQRYRAGAGAGGLGAAMSERDHWMKAVQARLSRVTAQDLSPVLEEDALAEIRELARILQGGRDPDSAEAMYELGRLHWYRYVALPDEDGLPDLREAAFAFTQCFLDGIDSGFPEPLLPVVAGRAADIAAQMLEMAQRSGDQGFLVQTVAIWRRILALTPADDPERAWRLSGLGTALLARFVHAGTAADLDAAVEAGQQAVEAAPPGHPNRVAILSNLSSALRARFERVGAVSDLDAAITGYREALRIIPVDHPGRLAILSNLGDSLRVRFERIGSLEDLNAAVEAGRQALRATPADHPRRATILSNLGTALHARFVRSGSEEDLDAAITGLREAMQGTWVEGDPYHAVSLSSLGVMLYARFNRSGALADLEAAVAAGRQAAEKIPVGHPERPRILHRLGNALQARFVRTRIPADLDAAIEAEQQAVEAISADHPEHAWFLSTLGEALLRRFDRNGVINDLDTAITNLRECLRVIPADDPGRAAPLSVLGGALNRRFDLTGSEVDLNAAIDAGRHAAEAVPRDQPGCAVILSQLGRALWARYEHNGAQEDRIAAFRLYEEAAHVDTAPVSTRIHAARAAAQLVAETDPRRGASLLEAAVLLLPNVAPRFLEREDQQHAIGRFAGLAAEAAALALSDLAVSEPERPVRALQMLEAARGVLLSLVLSVRSDLSHLLEHHPDIAKRFIELRDSLERPTPASHLQLADQFGASDSSVWQRPTWDRREADAEFTRVITRIRSLEGFSTFGLPPTVGYLEAQAELGPVVAFNVSPYRSDAILLTKGGISSLSLPGLGHDTVIGQINVFYRALSEAAALSAPTGARAQETIREVLAWLWDNATEPVLDALGYGKPPSSGGPWPRVWWVSSGLLAMLPIHAAGHHGDPTDLRRSVIDRVISSYTPTVRALTHARNKHTAMAPVATMRSLLVAMPTTPGLANEGRLKFVPAEAALMRHRLPSPTVLTEGTAGDVHADPLPTKAAVLTGLSDCAIAHFACHGYADPADPSRSRLLLHDHRHDPLTVAALAPLALDHAQLAYLSACSTANVTDPSLLDEAIHLASAFQLVGFPHVIGTLWEINDKIAVEIADEFYANLTNHEGSLDPQYSAEALHHTIRTQRDRRPANPGLWASYIHVGV
jgi:hypothetical protein